MSEAKGPNLDAMDPDDLMSFWMRAGQEQGRSELRAEYELEHVTSKDIDALACYAVARSSQMSLQAAGQIPEAQVYETHCEIYYEMLSPAARW